MIRTPNDQLIRETLEHLKKLYIDTNRHEGIHLTDLIYCLTRSYWDKVDPLPPTDEEVLLFSLGWGLQQVLVPREQDAEVLCVDGIYMSPDFISLGGVMAELKTTRQSSRRKNPNSKEYEPSPFSETWVEQMMGYCYANQKLHIGTFEGPVANIGSIRLPPGFVSLGGTMYDLLILHMMGSYSPPFPLLKGWRVEFTTEELQEFWATTLVRKAILTDCLERRHSPPEPKLWCKEWECESCRFEIRCMAL